MSARGSSRDPHEVHTFDYDTSVAPAGKDLYSTVISDGWNALGGMPNGGYLVAVSMQALRRELAMPDPLVVSAFFLRRAAPGPASLETEIARTGRRHATGSVRMLQRDEEVMRALATFADLGHANGRTLVLNSPPELPAPDECVDPLSGKPFPGVSITEQIEYRLPEIPGWVGGQPSGRPHHEFWIRFKDDRPIDPLALVALVDAAAPVVVEIGEGSSTVELTVQVRARPAPGPWVACRAVTRHIIGGYHEEDFEIWDTRGHLVAQSRQLALLPKG